MAPPPHPPSPTHPPRQIDRAFQARLRQVYLDRDVKCPRCRYQLRGVPGPLCPECGLDVSDHLRIADTTAWRLQRARLRWLVRKVAFWSMAALMLIACLALWLVTR